MLRSYSLFAAPQNIHFPSLHVWLLCRKRIFPSAVLNFVTEKLLFEYLLQYRLRRASKLVISVIAIPNSCFWKIWSTRSYKSGIYFSSPFINCFATSRKNTPLLVAGFRNVESTRSVSCFTKSSIAFTSRSEINTSQWSATRCFDLICPFFAWAL